MKRLGQWNQDEHKLYLEAMVSLKSWDQVSKHVKTRDPVQCRSHHQKMKCKINRDIMRFSRSQISRHSSWKKDVGTQWEPNDLKYYSTLPVFRLDKIVDLDTGYSNCSTGTEDMSLRSISIFSSDAEGFKDFTSSESSEEF